MASVGLGIGIYVVIGIIYFFSTASFTAWLASKKGYSSGIWFVLGLFFGFIALLAMGFSPNQLKNNSNKNQSE
jgi:4-hydroxybenzoate polyprenyltransferase